VLITPLDINKKAKGCNEHPNAYSLNKLPLNSDYQSSSLSWQLSKNTTFYCL